MGQKFSNNATTTLSGALASGATSMSLTDATIFPNIYSPNFCLLTLENEDASVNEIVKVTSKTGNPMTIERGQEGTSDLTWPSGTKVEMRLTAGTLDEFVQTPAADADLDLGHVKVTDTTVNLGKNQSGEGILIGNNLKGSYTNDAIIIGQGNLIPQYRGVGYCIAGPSVLPFDTFGQTYTGDDGVGCGSPVLFRTPMVDLGVPNDWSATDKYRGDIVKATTPDGTRQYRLWTPGDFYVSSATEPTWPTSEHGTVDVDASSYPGSVWIMQDPQAYNGIRYSMYVGDNGYLVIDRVGFFNFDSSSSLTATVEAGVDTFSALGSATVTGSSSRYFSWIIDVADPAPAYQGGYNLRVKVTTPAVDWSFRGWFVFRGYVFDGRETY